MDRVGFYINLKDADFAGETIGSFGEVIEDFGACDTTCARRRRTWETKRGPAGSSCGEIEFTDGAGQEEDWEEADTETPTGRRPSDYGLDFWDNSSGASSLVTAFTLATAMLLTN